MDMVRFLTRRNALASGSLLLSSTFASAFLKPNTYRTVTTARCQFKVSPRFSPFPALYDTMGDQRRDKTTVKTYKKKKGEGHKRLYRADKVLSLRTSISRSEAFDLLKRRRVAVQKPGTKGPSSSAKKSSPDNNNDGQENLKNLMTITGPKVRVPMDAILWLDGRPIPPPPPMMVAFHKPKFVLSAMFEKHSNKTHLGMFLPEQYKKVKMHPVGRLDYDTSGLILFTTHGKVTQRLLHPKFKVEKEYVATVSGKVDDETLKQQLEVDGVVTTEGTHFAKLLNVEVLDLAESERIKMAHLSMVEIDNEPELSIVQNMELPLTNVRISVQEGKYRMVRRMLANCNHPVVELRRERHGMIELRDLPEGEFRPCDDDEIKWAKSLIR